MSDKLTRRDFIIRSGVVAGTAAIAPTVLAKSKETFKVGAVLELSGLNATGGQLCKRGYELWAKTVNNAGGIKIGNSRHKVELIVQDCRSQPALGAAACERLIVRENVDVLFGAYTSGVQIAMNPIAAKYRTPCIAGSAESPGNWTPHPPFTYGIIPAVDLTAGKSISNIVSISNPKAKTAAVIGANEPFSKDTAIGFRNGAENAGLEIVYYTLFPRNADLTPIGNLIAEKSPDIVAVGGHDVMLSNAVKALKGAGFTPDALIEHYGVTDPAFVKELNEDANGVMGITVWRPDAPYEGNIFGSAQEYAAAYEKAYGTRPDYTTAGCSTAGVVLTKALQELGEKPALSRDAKSELNKIIAKTDMVTFYGPVKFESSGDHFHNNTALNPLLVQYQDKKLVTIAPAKAAKAEAIYPMKPWTKRA